MSVDTHEKSPKTRKFSVGEYEKMVETGVLTENDKVELIRGEIIKMTPIGRRHAACVKKLNTQFSKKLADQVIVGVQDPIRIPPESQPEPDITLVEKKDDYYASGHPEPEQIYLVVEVAETSTSFDREQKIPLYAESGIKEVWLVNLEANKIKQYRSPSETSYDRENTFTRSDRISPLEFPEVSVDVGNILPASE